MEWVWHRLNPPRSYAYDWSEVMSSTACFVEFCMVLIQLLNTRSRGKVADALYGNVYWYILTSFQGSTVPPTNTAS